MSALVPGLVTYGALAQHVRQLPSPLPVRLVAVDGRGASGKSTFASRLAAALGGAPVVHTDDIASHEVPLAWWPILEEWVLGPLAAGRPGGVAPYDWTVRRRRGVVVVPAAPVVLLEGVSAARRAVRARLTCAIWIDTAAGLRARRALDRDGPAMAEFWAGWVADEEAFYAADPVQDSADLVVDGAPAQPHDAEREFVLRRA